MRTISMNAAGYNQHSTWTPLDSLMLTFPAQVEAEYQENYPQVQLRHDRLTSCMGAALSLAPFLKRLQELQPTASTLFPNSFWLVSFWRLLAYSRQTSDYSQEFVASTIIIAGGVIVKTLHCLLLLTMPHHVLAKLRNYLNMVVVVFDYSAGFLVGGSGELAHASCELVCTAGLGATVYVPAVVTMVYHLPAKFRLPLAAYGLVAIMYFFQASNSFCTQLQAFSSASEHLPPLGQKQLQPCVLLWQASQTLNRTLIPMLALVLPVDAQSAAYAPVKPCAVLGVLVHGFIGSAVLLLLFRTEVWHRVQWLRQHRPAMLVSDSAVEWLAVLRCAGILLSVSLYGAVIVAGFR